MQAAPAAPAWSCAHGGSGASTHAVIVKRLEGQLQAHQQAACSGSTSCCTAGTTCIAADATAVNLQAVAQGAPSHCQSCSPRGVDEQLTTHPVAALMSQQLSPCGCEYDYCVHLLGPAHTLHCAAAVACWADCGLPLRARVCSMFNGTSSGLARSKPHKSMAVYCNECNCIPAASGH